MRPDDIALLAACGRPSLTPDGELAVVAVTAPSLEHDDYVGSLVAVPTAAAPAAGRTGPRRLTRGHRDTAPAVSPDGRWVAFLRAGPAGGASGRAQGQAQGRAQGQAQGRPQVHLVETAGGEPVAVTTAEHHPLGAGEPVWSPDGRTLAHVARVPEPGRYGTEEGVGPDAEPPRVVTTLAYRIDGVGYTRDRRPHVFTVDVSPLVAPAGALVAGAGSPDAVPAPRQVTDGPHDDGDVAWSLDGAQLLFTSDRHPTADADRRRGLYRVPAAAVTDGPLEGPAEPALVVGGDLHVLHAAASPDGAGVLLLAAETGPDGLDLVARPTSLWSAPLDGSADPHRLTDPEVDLGDPASHLVVTDHGALVQERTRGALHLLRVPLAQPGEDPPAPELVLGGHRQVLAVASAGGSTVAVVADAGTPGDLVHLDGSTVVPLTDVAAPLRAAGVRPLREVSYPAPDGYPVHGWVVLPDPAVHGGGGDGGGGGGGGEEHRHPVLLMVHGGPFSQYGWGVFDEAQVLAAAGYAVVMGNPRGSAGYGVGHGRAVFGAMGGPDALDVLALLDGALADPDLPLDPERVGVLGGSYGGYMTALLTTRTTRFAAAVVERGYLDAVSFVGSSDIGWYFPQRLHGSEQGMVEQSPMTHVGAVRTPTLVIHSEQDWRCPVEQGQRWFTALHRQGVETELLLFPGEGHELTRSGRPKHRVARFEHLLGWWARHLPPTRA